MIFFIILFFFLLLICGSKYSSVGLIGILFFLSILIGFRGLKVGADTETYAFMYQDLGTYGYGGYPEILFGYLNLVFYRWGFSFHFFQWCMSLIMMGLIGQVIIKDSPRKGFAVFTLYALFFIFYAMNVFRQMLAVSIVLYGYHLLYKGKRLKFVLCVLVATSCHIASIFSLAILGITKMKITRTLFWSGVTFSFLLGCIVISDSLFIKLAGPYASYLLDTEQGFRSEGRVFQAILLSVFWNCLAICIYLYIDKNYRNNFWFKIYFISIVITNLLLRLELGLRILFYFSIVEIILFPVYIAHNRLKPHWMSYFIVIIFLSLFFFTFLYNGSACVYPYDNVLLDAMKF